MSDKPKASEIFGGGKGPQLAPPPMVEDLEGDGAQPDTCPFLGFNVFPVGVKADPAIITGQQPKAPQIEYATAGQQCLREKCAMWDPRRHRDKKDGCLVRSGLRAVLAAAEREVAKP